MQAKTENDPLANKFMLPWRLGSYELSEKAIRNLIEIAELKSSERFADLGSGTGSVVIEAVRHTQVRRAVGVEYGRESHEIAFRNAVERLDKDLLKRVDFWYGDIFSEHFDYTGIKVVYNSFEEDEDEIPFYRKTFGIRLRVLKKDLPFVGYDWDRESKSAGTWLYRMDFPLRKIRRRSKWAGKVLGRDSASMENVLDYYRRVLNKRGIRRKEIALALNSLRKLAILRF